jgi:hypothetical protein
MTTRKGLLIAAVVMAMLPLAAGVGVAQDRDPRYPQAGHCEGAYDEKEGTNFGLCHASGMAGESKSVIGDIPESPGDSQ